MKPWLRQGIWLAVALIVPLLLSLALLPLRGHVSDVLIALILLTVSAAAVARGELLLSLVAATSTALSFDYFFAVPYDQLAIRGTQGVVTTVALIAAVPALGSWIARLYGKEAARERELREKAERYAEELAERQRQVEQLAAELTASRRRILAVGDQMRRRIERDLHDGAQQRLVTLSLMLRGIRDRAPADVRADVDEVCDGLGAALQELRDLSRGLHPAILGEAGLGPAVRALARHSPLPVRVQVRADGRLPGSCEATAYYVAAEAFTNAAKHAAASAVDILIERTDGALTVQVRDDGVGGADATRGSGLVGLRDRVEAVGGTMTLDSPARAGTVLTVRLPVTAEDHLSERTVVHPPVRCEPAENSCLASASSSTPVISSATRSIWVASASASGRGDVCVLPRSCRARETSRCWAPSCRSRSMRGRAVSAAATIRARNAVSAAWA
jgi:signal transduction histidine kinase